MIEVFETFGAANNDSRFFVFSATKPIVASAAWLLMGEGLLDVTLPVARLAEFIPDVRAAIATVDPAAQSWLFGHVADGNIHVNVTGVEASTNRVDDAVFQLVARYRGSISAEHGIGRLKRDLLPHAKQAIELELMRKIKTAFDPNGILNPGKLLA